MNRPDPPDTEAAVALREKFAAGLAPGSPSPWRTAFARVPRHVCVPRFYRQLSDLSWQPVERGDDGYLESVYADTALTTQLDGRSIPTSSSSRPSLMLSMLDALGALPGQRVLELGTGTGYNLALLADRLGDENLVSIEPDRAIVQAAVQHLEQAGYRPAVITGDGTLGHPPGAPYDRIIATVGLSHIPHALLAQGMSGTVIIAPLGHGIVRLTLTGGGCAEGRFLSLPARFMPVRGPSSPPDFEAVGRARPSRTGVAPEEVLGRLQFALSLALPGHTTCTWRGNGERIEAVGIWTPDGSAVLVHASGEVRQQGARCVWDTVEQVAAALPQQWAREDFGLTATPEEQVITYGGSGGPQWRLPSA
ncbi:methyltransferase domain-containing protein [Streptomyces sp. NPDC046939]|uniref:methyltransferase domain-containing protein n=1 Tax=Streptomyces sp. NPDC046939 TaxID=3155376 RepID=UPI0033DA82EF